MSESRQETDNRTHAASVDALPRLDVAALQQAVDAERIRRGLSWSALAKEVRYSTSSLRTMTRSARIEADAVCLLLQWLRRPCDDFTIYSGKASTSRRRLRTPVPLLFARFDTIALHAAMDGVRKKRQLSWDEVAVELGITRSVIDRFTLGGRTTANQMIAAAAWAGKPIEALLQPSTPILGHARMDAKASQILPSNVLVAT